MLNKGVVFVTIEIALAGHFTLVCPQSHNPIGMYAAFIDLSQTRNVASLKTRQNPAIAAGCVSMRGASRVGGRRCAPSSRLARLRREESGLVATSISSSCASLPSWVSNAARTLRRVGRDHACGVRSDERAAACTHRPSDGAGVDDEVACELLHGWQLIARRVEFARRSAKRSDSRSAGRSKCEHSTSSLHMVERANWHNHMWGSWRGKPSCQP